MTNHFDDLFAGMKKEDDIEKEKARDLKILQQEEKVKQLAAANLFYDTGIQPVMEALKNSLIKSGYDFLQQPMRTSYFYKDYEIKVARRIPVEITFTHSTNEVKCEIKSPHVAHTKIKSYIYNLDTGTEKEVLQSNIAEGIGIIITN